MRDEDQTDLTGWLGLRKLPDLTKARWLGPALAVSGALIVGGLFVLALGAAFVLLSTAVFGSLLDDPRSALGVGGVTVALIGAPFVIWRSVVAQKTVNVTEQGHITDRINKAVEGLGAEKTVKLAGEEEQTVANLEVRIGAIYALERIAQDSDRDHLQIMEILCAYIRQNAPAPAEDDWPELELYESEDDGPLEADWGDRRRNFREKQEAAKARLKPREDIQTALTVIGRRSAKQRRLEAGRGKEAPFPFDIACPEYDGPGHAHDPAALKAFRRMLLDWTAALKEYEGYRLDLRNADLRGVDLFGAELKGARLDGTCLQGADLRKARLQGARLVEARLQRTDLWAARLQGARLVEARLQGAHLVAARLHGARLVEARLQGALLVKARLQGARLMKARLQGARLMEARLQGALLAGTRLQGTNLEAVRLDEHTKLAKAILRGAAARSVDLTDIPQVARHLPEMFGDASVTLPRGHGSQHENWPPHWPKNDLGPRAFSEQWRKWQADPENYRPPEADETA